MTQEDLKTIVSDHLVPMDRFVNDFPIRIDLAYARHDNIIFLERIYDPDTRLWLYKDLARVVLLAAKRIYADHGHRVVLYDGLRTTDAQARMLKTKRVMVNPHWLQEPRLLSPPGAGGHPRGMAIDISLEEEDGALLDMGTPFDYLAENSAPHINPAHREHPNLPQEVTNNRNILEQGMVRAAEDLDLPLKPLPQEWWDFRFPDDVFSQYVPLSDRDVPEQESNMWQIVLNEIKEMG